VVGLDWTTGHTADAYDLTIDDLHTFHVVVGDNDALVHNCGKYTNPGHHDPRSPRFNVTKSVLPKDAEELFRSSIEVSGSRWTKVGTGRNAAYHRVSNDGTGRWHWSGSTVAVKHDGTPNPIPLDRVPIVVKRS
jgi:hypothetical protein